MDLDTIDFLAAIEQLLEQTRQTGTTEFRSLMEGPGSTFELSANLTHSARHRSYAPQAAAIEPRPTRDSAAIGKAAHQPIEFALGTARVDHDPDQATGTRGDSAPAGE